MLYQQEGSFHHNVDTNSVISTTEAYQNFSKVTRILLTPPKREAPAFPLVRRPPISELI
jgi:hypothetical protein